MTEQTEIWNTLFERAKATLNIWKISPFIEAGGVAAALLTESGNIYTGVCVDTACSMGFCAERNAIGSMITAGEHKVTKVVALNWQAEPLMPCGVCREFFAQLDETSKSIEFLVNLETEETVTLAELLPKGYAESKWGQQSDD